MLDYDESLLQEALVLSPLVKSVTPLHPRCMAEPWAKKRTVCRGFRLEIDLDGKSTSFYFGVKKSFPLSLPFVYLVQWDSFGILPHVEDDGYICYAQEEGSVLNYEDIAGLVQEALSKAVQVIIDGISGKNHQDFIGEFGAYWDRLKKVKPVTSIVSPGGQVKRIRVFKFNDGQWWLADDELSFRKFRKIPPHVSLKHSPGIYIPLNQGTIITPPHPSRFWGLSEIRTVILNNLWSDQDAAFLSFTVKHHHDEVILIGLPNAAEGETLFGIQFKGVSRGHPLCEEGSAREIIPLSITRRDKEYLLPRGGSNLALRKKSVLLLGCGSLGGFIANELTRAGISHLTVLDKDILTHENLFRHVLGKKNVRKYKAEGIKNDIEGRLPYVEVIPVCSSLEDAVRSGKIKVGEFDLIISALGNVTVELAFNKYIHDIDVPPVIFTWLEPYGIGGHALLTKLNGSEVGCLKCLYPLSDGYCRASFSEKGQSFAQNINGCRNVFTPFGSLDAIKTAELATRLAIAALTGDVKANLIRSWRGDATDFLKSGKALSSRYYEVSDHFVEVTDYHFGECTVCRESEI